MNVSALRIEPGVHLCHELHRGDRAWLESNCYVDLWIEVVHALGLEPRAALPFTVALDFEGDQWLFYKQPTADLYDLYGIDVQELAIFRPVLEHAVEQVSRGHIVLLEVDAHYLPDTRGVSYRTTHTKTTIGIESLDIQRRRLGYFHNAGYFTLEDQDFSDLFQDPSPSSGGLAPYTEFAKLDRVRSLADAELVRASLALFQRHLQRAPKANPFTTFASRFQRDLAELRGKPADAFHQYAFATLRQCGSCFDLAGCYLRWLETKGEGGLETVAAKFDTIATSAKAVQLKAARAVLIGRPSDFEATLASMEQAWQSALTDLQARYLEPIS